jgi:hypothetical protein
MRVASSAAGVLLGVVLALTSHAGPPIGIRGFEDGLRGVRSANPEMKLSIDRDSGEGHVLVVEYPAPSGDPAARDIWCEVENSDWSGTKQIVFNARAEHALKLSLSFMDRNRVAYTHWVELRGGEWQTVRIPFDQLRPNPYFQPPDAKKGAPLDVSEVRRIGFAPQDPAAGRLAIGQIVLEDY